MAQQTIADREQELKTINDTWADLCDAQAKLTRHSPAWMFLDGMIDALKTNVTDYEVCRCCNTWTSDIREGYCCECSEPVETPEQMWG